MLDSVLNIGQYALSFIFVITIIVFIHEYGHYFFAKLFGVHVEKFSIGFGPEICGKNDKSGTRWSIAAIPMGGYVKMFGDGDPASTPDQKKIESMSDSDKKRAFEYKNLKQKSLIVAGGPIANFLLSIILIAGLFVFYGHSYTLPIITAVQDGSPAQHAGLQAGDKILKMDNHAVESFEDVGRRVVISSDPEIEMEINRENNIMLIMIKPEIAEMTDSMGNKSDMPRLGISSDLMTHKTFGPIEALHRATIKTYGITLDILDVMGQIIQGKRGTDDLGGPIRIAKYSGQSAQNGLKSLIWFMALLSINLGLINLFPIPALDGGHLMFYVIEALTSREISMKFQNYGTKIGIGILLLIFALSTFNDVRYLLK